MYEFLLEIFSEEMPALVQKNAATSFKASFKSKLEKFAFQYKELSVFYGPRRMSFYIEDIDNKNTDYESIKLNLIEIIKSVLSGYSWTKSLNWDDTDLKWGRPIRNMSCIFNGDILKFSYYNLKSNNYSYGHRSTNTKFFFNSFLQYCEELEKNFIILDQEKKKESVKQELLIASKKFDLDVYYTERFLEEVLGRVEYPVVLLGKIKTEFLTMPEEIIKESMMKHQKYFPLVSQSKKLAPYFLFISNLKIQNYTKIIFLNEKILEARLADGFFFYNQDLKDTSEGRLIKLKTLNFHNNLGNFYDKSMRLISISAFLANNDPILEQAAKFCKSDLISNIVQEFPNLQAVVGYYMLLKEKYPIKVANIVKEHYKPISEKDDLPSTKESAMLSIADKLDNIVGVIISGGSFSGSKDPFAIRRQIISIIKMILNYKFDINIRNLIKHSANLYPNKNDDLVYKIFNIFRDKIFYFFKNKYQKFACVMLRESDFDKSLTYLNRKIDFLDKNKNKIYGLFSIHKRCFNLIPKKFKAIIEQNVRVIEVNKFNFEVLLGSYVFCIKKSDSSSMFEQALINYLASSLNMILTKDYIGTLEFLVKISGIIENFLNNSLIQTKEEKLYELRVGLLIWINSLFFLIGNFSILK